MLRSHCLQQLEAALRGPAWVASGVLQCRKGGRARGKSGSRADCREPCRCLLGQAPLRRLTAARQAVRAARAPFKMASAPAGRPLDPCSPAAVASSANTSRPLPPSAGGGRSSADGGWGGRRRRRHECNTGGAAACCTRAAPARLLSCSARLAAPCKSCRLGPVAGLGLRATCIAQRLPTRKLRSRLQQGEAARCPGAGSEIKLAEVPLESSRGASRTIQQPLVNCR